MCAKCKPITEALQTIAMSHVLHVADLASMLNYTSARVPARSCPALNCTATKCVNGRTISARDANGW